MHLLDLPPELLALIAQYIGCAQLQASSDYLLISKAWYGAVLPVYLSGLQLSTIYVLSNDLDRFPHPNSTGLGQAIQKRVTRLTLCLDGVPSRDTHSWDDKEGFSEDTQDWFDLLTYCHRYGCSKTVLGRLEDTENLVWDIVRDAMNPDGLSIVHSRNRTRHDEIQEAKELERRLPIWRQRMNERLMHFAWLLPACKNLREFKLETTLTPRWDYLFDFPVCRLLAVLPSTVTHLTLDLSASDLVAGRDGIQRPHICALISRKLQNFKSVRLRMQRICPCIFENTTATPDAPPT